MTRAESWLYWLVAAIGLVTCVACSASLAESNERMRKNCAGEANFAVDLFKDVKTGAIVNVMPKDQPTLDIVQAHKGTERELWQKVYGDCAGVKT